MSLKTLAEIVSPFPSIALLGDNVVKYKLIFRISVTFMAFTTDDESTLTLSFGDHFFNLFYHLMRILPQVE